MRKAIIDNPQWALQYGDLFLKTLDDRISQNGSTGGEMAAYMLKDIPDDLWLEARKKALDNHKTMGKVLIELLRDWTEKGDQAQRVRSGSRRPKIS